MELELEFDLMLGKDVDQELYQEYDLVLLYVMMLWDQELEIMLDLMLLHHLLTINHI